MKNSDVYRKAAWMLEKGVMLDGEPGSPYACDKIGEAVGWHGSKYGSEKHRLRFIKLRDRYARLFAPREGVEGLAFFGRNTEANQNARVLSLCFMAAIADSERST